MSVPPFIGLFGDGPLTRRLPSPNKTAKTPERSRMEDRHDKWLKDSRRINEKRIPPTADPTATKPTASPCRPWNQ
jgi:hypothetical protein